jgi:glycine dehydrogenase
LRLFKGPQHSAIIAILARQAAIKAVKEQARHQGLKPTYNVEARDRRFCRAMIAIRQEIREIEAGRMSKSDNPLKNAPLTASDLIDEEWKRPYSRRLGCYPAGLDGDKYLCQVNRIDNAYGDRHLICCRPPASYRDFVTE